MQVFHCGLLDTVVNATLVSMTEVRCAAIASANFSTGLLTPYLISEGQVYQSPKQLLIYAAPVITSVSPDPNDSPYYS